MSCELRVTGCGLGGAGFLMSESTKPAAEPIILAENLYKSYRRGSQEVAVLEGITLAIEEGSFVALMALRGREKPRC